MKKLFDIIRDEDCTRCGLYKEAQLTCLVGDGPYPAEIMLIGEAPGWREEDLRKPFSGKAGKLLDKILASIGLDRENLFISNAVRCRPLENRTPRIKEIEACRYFLDKEIKYVKPKKIIAMGKSAILGLYEDKNFKIETMRGKIFEYKGIKVYSTYHPAAALRRPFLTKVIRKDLKNYILGVTNGNEKPVKYKDINDKNEIDIWSKVAIDLEWDIPTSAVRTMALCPVARKAYFIESPFRFKPQIMNLLEDSYSLKIGHNLKSDLKVCLKEGYIREKYLPDNNFFCTMIASNVLDENYLQKDLEHLATMNTSMERWKTEEDFGSIKKLRIRNLKDADAAKRLYNVFSKKIVNEHLEIPFRIDIDMMKVLVSAESHGIKIDTKELNDLDFELTKKIKKMASDIPANPGSNKQLTEYFNSIKIRSPENTGKGIQSWGKETLLKLSNELEGKRKEAVDAIINYKKLFGIKSKFLDNLSKFLDSEDMVHPVFNQVKAIGEESGDEEGTVTGRLSCKDPPLQTIPRDRESLPREINPRRLFIPVDPKGFILTGDYEQIEVRTLAHESGDEALIEYLKKGDIHRAIASEVLEKPPDKVTKDERKNAKKVTFGIIYLISAYGLALRLGCSKDKAAKYIRNFYKAFPETENWQSSAESEIIKNQQIPNMFMRLRRLPGATNETAIGRSLIRQGVNFPNQGGAVDIVKIAMFKIFRDLIKEGARSRIFENVHDELGICGYHGEEKAVVKIVKSRMENPGLEEFGVKLKVPLKVKLSIGPNWLEVKEIN